MPTVRSGVSEFAQAMANHILRDVNGNMSATIVHGKGVPHHLGEDHTGPAPGTNNFLVATFVHGFNFFQQFRANERPFLK